MSWIMSREERINMYIRAWLRGLLKNAKNGSAMAFEVGFDKLCAALEYAYYMGDISEETKNRVKRLAGTIEKKYFIK